MKMSKNNYNVLDELTVELYTISIRRFELINCERRTNHSAPDLYTLIQAPENSS